MSRRHLAAARQGCGRRSRRRPGPATGLGFAKPADLRTADRERYSYGATPRQARWQSPPAASGSSPASEFAPPLDEAGLLLVRFVV